MNELFAAFGIDWRLLLINFFNFGLLLFLLWYFLYEPLTKMLEERRGVVTEGVHNAHRAQKALQEIEQSRIDMLAQASQEADAIVAQARAAAADKGREIVAQNEAAAANLLKEAQAQATQLEREAIARSKEEVAKLIVLGMEKTMVEKSR